MEWEGDTVRGDIDGFGHRLDIRRKGKRVRTLLSIMKFWNSLWFSI